MAVFPPEPAIITLHILLSDHFLNEGSICTIMYYNKEHLRGETKSNDIILTAALILPKPVG